MADLQFVESIAYDALKQYGLTDWTVKWNRRLTALGVCRYAKKALSLSKYWMFVVDEDVALNTILHEVAHALVMNRHGRWATPHGSEWKRVCREIGCIPKRAASYDTVMAADPWMTRAKAKAIYDERHKK